MGAMDAEAEPVSSPADGRIDALRRVGAYEPALVLARSAVEAARSRGSRDLASWLLLLGGLQDDLGDEQAADASFEEARATAAAAAARDLQAVALARRAELACSNGQLDLAANLIAEARRLGGEALAPADPRRIDVAAAAVLVALERGDADAAGRLVAEADVLLEPLAGAARDVAEFRVATAEGTRLRALGRHAEAAAAFEQAAASARDAFGPGSLEVARALNDLGMTAKFRGRFDEARSAYERARQILEAAFGDEHPDLAAVLHNLGGLAHAEGDLVAAEVPARRAAEIRERTLGADHPATIRDRAALAAILDGLGRSDEAEPMLRDAIERLAAALGPDHPEVAVNLNNLAALLQRRGNLVEAEALYRRSVRIKERIAPDSPALAITLSNLATVVRRLGRAPEAEALGRRAITILERSVEPDHPALRAARRNLERTLSAR